MIKILPILFLILTSWSFASNALSELRVWKLKKGTVSAKIVYLSADKLKVYYAEADDVIKEFPLALFDDSAIKIIKDLDLADKRLHGINSTRPTRFSPAPLPEAWPPLPGKGWQIRNWNVNRNALNGADPKDYNARDKRTEFKMGAALWWHSNFTFRHKKAKNQEKLLKSLYRVFRKEERLSSEEFVPEDQKGKVGVMINTYRQVKPSEFDQFLGGNCVTGIYITPHEGSRNYRSDYSIIKKAAKKGSYVLHYWGNQVTGHFVQLQGEKGKTEEYVFEYDDLDRVPDWFKDRKLKFHYSIGGTYSYGITTMIPVERQIPGVKWMPHPTSKKVEKAKEPKPVADSVVLPDNEIDFLDKQRPLTMEITSSKGKSTIATVHKLNEGQVKIRKRNSNHTLAVDTLDFESQMKLHFWKANHGVKYKLPACRLHYKVRGLKSGYGYNFTIAYDGISKCYLTTQNHNEEVYFNSETVTYSVYKSEKGRLLLKAKHPYHSENKLEYPTQGRLGDNRKNYPSTTASDTNGFADRVIMSKSTTINNHRDVKVLKAAHVEAQPVVQFMHGFSNIQVPATQTISRSNFSLVSTMRLLYENATLPMELQWTQARHAYSTGRNKNVFSKELMELTLEKITPLEKNFFHQFEMLEAAEEAAEAKKKAAEKQ